MATELAGSEALLNLSLLAITFAAVSALVMLVRQTMGGRLSNFDVYLITSYVSLGFVVAIAATLPSIIVLFEPRPPVLWAVASLSAAVLHGGRVADVLRRRRKVSPEPISRGVLLTFLIHGLSVAMLVVNAAVPVIQGPGLFIGALTLALATTMWAFVRRIASLLGDKPGEDWDPKRG